MSIASNQARAGAAENEKLVRTMAAVRDMILTAPEALRQHSIEHGGAILEAGGHDLRPVYENGEVQFDAWEADRIIGPRIRTVHSSSPIVRIALRGRVGVGGAY